MFPLLLSLMLTTVSTHSTVKISEDEHLNFTQLSFKYGYESEEFYVITEDGYNLTLFHFKGNEGKPPVLLMHGAMDSSDAYVLRGKNSIGIALADEGYDVWAGNVRGNKYSRRHVVLSPENNNKQYWNFSFHEMGVYDLPATIDFILDKTGKKKLSAIGHSQGNTIFFILGSEKPEYNDKVSVFVALAPIALTYNLQPGFNFVLKSWGVITKVLKQLGIEEVLSDNGAVHKIEELVCSQGRLAYDICERLGLGNIIGEDSAQLEPEFFRVLLGHFPAGTSRKDLDHYLQMADNKRFAQFDNNVNVSDRYSAVGGPPAYYVPNVTMPVALLAGGQDEDAVVIDVEHLKNELPNVIHFHIIDQFNHIDFVYAKDLQTCVIPTLKYLLLKFNVDEFCTFPTRLALS